MTDPLNGYMLGVSLREPARMADLRAEIDAMTERELATAPEQGPFMAFLVKTLGAKRALEVGVFTGYSAMAVALAMPDEVIWSREINTRGPTSPSAIAAAGVAHKIDFRLAPALETLSVLVTDEASAIATILPLSTPTSRTIRPITNTV